MTPSEEKRQAASKAKAFIERGLVAYSLSEKLGLTGSFAIASGISSKEDSFEIHTLISDGPKITIHRDTGVIEIDGEKHRSAAVVLDIAKHKIKALIDHPLPPVPPAM